MPCMRKATSVNSLPLLQAYTTHLFQLPFASILDQQMPSWHSWRNRLSIFTPSGDLGNGQKRSTQLEQGDEIFWRSRHLKGGGNPSKFVKVGNVSYTMMHWYCLVSSAVSLFAQLLSDKTESRGTLYSVCTVALSKTSLFSYFANVSGKGINMLCAKWITAN